MAWFRRDHQEPPAGAAVEQEQADTPDGLRESVRRMERFLNQQSGRLPGAAVVNSRRLTDTLRAIIDTSELRPLDVYAVISVRATLDDYLPTTLKGYLALDDGVLDAPLRSGRTPAEALLEQIEALQTSADLVLVAARDQDADALVTQGNFLRTKFSGSDLDL